MMESIDQYIESTSLLCEECSGSNVTLSVTFHNPRLSRPPFRYTIVKSIKSIKALQNTLHFCIFDLDNPLNIPQRKSVIMEDECQTVESVNLWLNKLKKKKDVFTFDIFVDWFGIQKNYCQWRFGSKSKQINDSKPSPLIHFCTDIPNKTQKKDLPRATIPVPMLWEEEMISPFGMVQQDQLKLLPLVPKSKLVGLLQCFINGQQFFLALQEYSSLTKVKSIIKAFFNKNKPCGALIVYKVPASFFCEEEEDSETMLPLFRFELEAEPFKVLFCAPSKTAVVATSIGIYIFRANQTKEKLQLITFLQMKQCVDICFNLEILYCLCEDGIYAVSTYILDKKKKTNIRGKCMLYVEAYKRLIVSGEENLFFFAIENDDFIQVRALQCNQFDQMVVSKEYLFGTNYEGTVTVVQLKVKDHLMGVSTYINTPKSKVGIRIWAANRHILLTEYNGCLVLLHTINGCICVKRIKETARIVELWWLESYAMAATEDGIIAVFTVTL